MRKCAQEGTAVLQPPKCTKPKNKIYFVNTVPKVYMNSRSVKSDTEGGDDWYFIII